MRILAILSASFALLAGALLYAAESSAQAAGVGRALDPTRDFVWQEGEGWARQQGAGEIRDRWQLISHRALGGSFGKQKGDFAEYLVQLPIPLENACLFVPIRTPLLQRK